MKTEELLRYREIYRALRARFGVRFVEFGFRVHDKPLTRVDPDGAEGVHRLDDGPQQSGSKSAE